MPLIRAYCSNFGKVIALEQALEKRGIYVHGTMAGLAEEAGSAYKDITVVVEMLKKAEITKRVVALKPIGNVKG